MASFVSGGGGGSKYEDIIQSSVESNGLGHILSDLQPIIVDAEISLDSGGSANISSIMTQTLISGESYFVEHNGRAEICLANCDYAGTIGFALHDDSGVEIGGIVTDVLNDYETFVFYDDNPVTLSIFYISPNAISKIDPTYINNGIYVANYGISSYHDVVSAYENGKTIMCKRQGTDSSTGDIISIFATLKKVTKQPQRLMDTYDTYIFEFFRFYEYGDSVYIDYWYLDAQGQWDSSSRNLVTYDDLKNVRTWYGTCSTGTNETAKVVSCNGFILHNGVTIDVKFTYGHATTSATLNVNNTGAKTITGATSGAWNGGDVVKFTYDGTNWNIVGNNKNWNNVELRKDTNYVSDGVYVPMLVSTNSTTAFLTYATSTPSQYRIAKYDAGSSLYSTTPASGDDSTKVATTAFVQDAIESIDALPSQSGNSGKYLTTNGTTASWGTVSVPKVYYGSCSTAANTAAKSVTCSGFVLEDGATINVYFNNANSADSPTLNVNSTGAKAIKKDTFAMPKYGWLAGQTVTFTFIGDASIGYWTVVGVNTYVTAGQKSGTTIGSYATAEGNNTTASYTYAHAEGYGTTASAQATHAEGYNTTASGNYSHAEGLWTVARRRSQHVFGEYNVLDTDGSDNTTKGTYIELVGNGTASDSRSNARTLDWSGNETLAGKLTVGADPVNNMDVATKQYVDNSIPSVPAQISKIYTGTCNTAASTATKTVTLDDSTGFSLTAGVRVAVTFTNGNSTATPALNVNSTGVYTIAISSGQSSYKTGDGTTYNGWGAYETLIFTYTGTYWVHEPSGRLSNLSYNLANGALPKSSTGGGGAYGVTLSVNSGAAGNVSDGYFYIYAWSDGNDSNRFQVDSTSTAIHKVVTPTADGDAANKKYVDDGLGTKQKQITVSTSEPTSSDGVDGDIWFVYEE